MMTPTVRPSALLDTNVVLDVLLERQPFLADAQAIWKACDDGALYGWVSAVTLTTIFYVGRKLRGAEKALEGVNLCLASFQVAPVDRAVIEAALKSGGSDFEDDVQIASAVQMRLQHIVTRDPADFAASPIAAVSPASLLDALGLRS
jgi:predicted nucleic acid-binding protein